MIAATAATERGKLQSMLAKVCIEEAMPMIHCPLPIIVTIASNV